MTLTKNELADKLNNIIRKDLEKALGRLGAHDISDNASTVVFGGNRLLVGTLYHFIDNKLLWEIEPLKDNIEEDSSVILDRERKVIYTTNRVTDSIGKTVIIRLEKLLCKE